MREKRKKAVAVLVDGIVHAIGDTKAESTFVAASDELPGPAWGALDPARPRMTRAQRKAARAQELRAWVDLLVRLLCEMRPLAPHVIFQYPPPRMTWRAAPRTHAQINCMACLVALART